jgi:hypothetical protein
MKRGKNNKNIEQDQNYKDFKEFCEVIETGDFDNRSLAIDLQMSLDIDPCHINSMTEIWGFPQYMIRYNNILITMYWDENKALFNIPQCYCVFDGDTIVNFVEV